MAATKHRPILLFGIILSLDSAVFARLIRVSAALRYRSSDDNDSEQTLIDRFRLVFVEY